MPATHQSGISLWSTTPASNNSTPPLGAPEGMAPSTVNDIMRQQMSDHRLQWEDAEWFDWGHTPVFQAGTTFRVSLSATAIYQISRRLKLYDSTGPLYATIASLASPGANLTDITVTLDSGTLTTSLSSVAVAVIAGTNRSVSFVPTGVIFDYGGTTAPPGWLACDGASYLNADYPVLSALIRPQFGGADAAHFYVPDFRRRVAVGSGGAGTATLAATVASVGGEETHTLTTPEMPSHTHTLALGAAAGAGGRAADYQNLSGNNETTSSTGGGGAHNIMQPSLVVLKIIKT